MSRHAQDGSNLRLSSGIGEQEHALCSSMKGSAVVGQDLIRIRALRIRRLTRLIARESQHLSRHSASSASFSRVTRVARQDTHAEEDGEPCRIHLVAPGRVHLPEAIDLAQEGFLMKDCKEPFVLMEVLFGNNSQRRDRERASNRLTWWTSRTHFSFSGNSL